MKSLLRLFRIQAFPRLRAGDVIVAGIFILMAAAMGGVYGVLRSPDASPEEIYDANMRWIYASLIMNIALLIIGFGIFLAVFRRSANSKRQLPKE